MFLALLKTYFIKGVCLILCNPYKTFTLMFGIRRSIKCVSDLVCMTPSKMFYLITEVHFILH